MAVTSQHVGANLQLKNTQRKHIITLHRLRPTLNSADAMLVIESITGIRGEAVGSAVVQVTSRLLAQ